jgi:hypothetical protein
MVLVPSDESFHGFEGWRIYGARKSVIVDVPSE